MKPMKLKLMIGTLAIVFLLATSAWADGRGRGGHRQNGTGYQHGYNKHHGYPYKSHDRRYGSHQYRGYDRGHGRHYRDRHYSPHAKRHYHYRPRRHQSYRPYASHHPYHGYGLSFSIFDPYFSFGFSTGGHH